MFNFLGRSALSTLIYFGELALLMKETFISIFRAPIRWRLVIQQVVQIGYRSQLVACATGAFTGAVFAAQLYFQMHKFGMDSSVGSVTAIALLRELGPALGGIMVAGRCGAAIAAEIGTMKVTEQVDALRALGVHPVDYLVVPRALAMMISMPLLIAEACALGILASNYVSIEVLGIAEAGYMRNLIQWVHIDDIAKALIKAFIFGSLVAFIACREGLAAENGAEGVGRAPTEAVVIASLTIIAANFVLTFALNVFFPAA
jgi:phospholipid/cholesterol/gamma-HCH transport system permease protein